MSTTQTSTQSHHDASNVNLNDMDVTAMTRHGVPNGLQTEKQWSLKSSQLHMKSIMSIVKKRCGKGKTAATCSSSLGHVLLLPGRKWCHAKCVIGQSNDTPTGPRLSCNFTETSTYKCNCSSDNTACENILIRTCLLTDVFCSQACFHYR